MRTLKKAGIVGIVVLVLFILIVLPLTTVWSTQNYYKKLGATRTTEISPTNLPTDFDGIVIFANITSFDPDDYTCSIQFSSYPSGIYASKQPGLTPKLEYPMKIRISDSVSTFPINDTIELPLVKVTIMDGDVNKYPFDKYDLYFYIFGMATVGNTTQYVPLSIQVSAFIPGFLMEPKFTQGGSDTELSIHITRGTTVIFFSIFVNLTMWLISISFTILAMTLCWRGRKVEPTTLASSIGLLFALPAIRNVQPGIPVVGCTADVISYFWAMILATISSLLLMWNYIIMYQKEKTFKDEKEPKPILIEVD